VCTAEAALAGGSSGTVSPELAARAAELMARSSSEDFKFIANEGPGIARAVEEAGDYTLAANAWFEIATSGFSIPNAIARDAARRASILAEKLGDHDLQARAWCWSAELAAEAGDFGGIDDMLAMASSAAEQTGKPATLMYVEITRADVLEREGDLDGAARICEAARARIAEANHALDSRLDDVLSCLGTTYLAQWRYDEAEVVERELLELRAKAYGPDSPMHLDTEMKLFGLEYRHDPAAASRKFHAAIARIEEIHGPESLLAMNAYSDLAITASEGTNIGTPEAIEASRKALAIGKKILDGHDPSLARLLTIDANIVFATDPAASMADYEQALAIYDHLDDLRHWAELAYNAADGFRQLDHCDRAVPLFERIVRLADAGELERTIGAASRGGLGVCQRILGDLTAAEVTLRSSVADLFALGLDDFAIQYKIELAEVVWRQGKKPAARAIAKEARDAVADDNETHRQLRLQAEDVVKRQ
jgi:tetratricopeptide (TPR) repeat protein